jgi:etoposide-induced 2.4 mRNA
MTLKGLLTSCHVRVKRVVWCFWAGLYDSIAVWRTVIFLLSSPKIRQKIYQCFILNGVIFLGSQAAQYLLRSLLAVLIFGGDVEENGIIVDVLQAFCTVIYHALWLYPIYAICFVLNTLWYGDIAHHAGSVAGLKLCGKPEENPLKAILIGLSDLIFRTIVIAALSIEASLLSYIPYIGSVISFAHLCWLFSMYCFDYRWSHMGWSTQYRVSYFEKHWAYFMGYGAPLALITVSLPTFVSLGLYALTFPIFVILATVAKPVKRLGRVDLASHARLPIFSAVSWVVTMVLARFLKNRV